MSLWKNDWMNHDDKASADKHIAQIRNWVVNSFERQYNIDIVFIFFALFFFWMTEKKYVKSYIKIGIHTVYLHRMYIFKITVCVYVYNGNRKFYDTR